MRNSSGADGNRRTVLTVPTVRTTNRATAGEQSERTAGEQCFCGGLVGSEYTWVRAHTILFTDVGALVIQLVCLSGVMLFTLGGRAIPKYPSPSFQRRKRNTKITQKSENKVQRQRSGRKRKKIFPLLSRVTGGTGSVLTVPAWREG